MYKYVEQLVFMYIENNVHSVVISSYLAFHRQTHNMQFVRDKKEFV